MIVKVEDGFYKGDSENLIKRTGDLKEDFRGFLLRVVRREEFYRVKVDCFQKTLP